jgi:hypothetical protein
MSGNSLENFSISSSPVTFTTVSLGASNSSKNKSFEVVRAAAAGRVGMSPSREMSGKADAAASKSMSSLPPEVKSLLRKSLIVDGGR